MFNKCNTDKNTLAHTFLQGTKSLWCSTSIYKAVQNVVRIYFKLLPAFVKKRYGASTSR